MKLGSFSTYLAGILLFLNLTSCYYFKVAESVPGGYEVEGALIRGKTLIVHTGAESFQMVYPSISNDKTTLIGKMAPVAYNHQFYKLVKGRVSNRYKKNMGDPSRDVNIYISEYTIDSFNQIQIPLTAVKRMDIYAKENTKSALSLAGGIVGGYYGLMLIILLLSGI